MSRFRLRSDRLREAARAKGDATSYAIARRTGLAESTLSRLNNGKSVPSTASLLVLSSTYGISVDELIQHEAPVKESA